MRTRTSHLFAAVGVLAALAGIAAVASFEGDLLQRAEAASASGESETLEWSSDLECSGCHAGEAASQENALEIEKGADSSATGDSEEDPGQKGAEAVGADYAAEGVCGYQIAKSHGSLRCTDCHNDEEGLAKAHEQVAADSDKVAKRLKKTEVANEACLACHETTYSADATAESAALVDTNGTTVNPHDLPESESHGNIACADCHRMHSADNLATTAAQTCPACHHANVYACGTCH